MTRFRTMFVRALFRVVATFGALLAGGLAVSPAMAGWTLYATSGNHYTQNTSDLATSSVGALDENLYQIDVATGALTYEVPVRNNVDASLAANGWSGPFFGENYRDNEGLGYNPLTGELYHFNGTIGYDAPPSPLSYDTRLIEAYDPLNNFARRDIVNSLTIDVGGVQLNPTGPVNPNFPVPGEFEGVSDATWDPLNNQFLVARREFIGAMNPVTGETTILNLGASVQPKIKGLSWYQDGAGGNRLFSMERALYGNQGNEFWELQTAPGPGFAEPIDGVTGARQIVIDGAPTGADMTRGIAMAQNPGTHDLYAIVDLTIPTDNAGLSSRHLIRFTKAAIDAFDANSSDIHAEYVGRVGGPNEDVWLSSLAFAFDGNNDPIPGDANDDGIVDGLDYIIWASNWGRTDPPDVVNGASDGDFNGDHTVDGLDYIIWATNFESQPAVPPNNAVPEPTALLLGGLALAGIALSQRRRRKQAPFARR